MFGEYGLVKGSIGLLSAKLDAAPPGKSVRVQDCPEVSINGETPGFGDAGRFGASKCVSETST